MYATLPQEPKEREIEVTETGDQMRKHRYRRQQEAE
jgi:hypothetical protein